MSPQVDKLDQIIKSLFFWWQKELSWWHKRVVVHERVALAAREGPWRTHRCPPRLISSISY
jgi:hypothetical protein